jgi:hypothetical protein
LKEKMKNGKRTKKIKGAGFEVLTAVSTKMAVFWVVAPCSLVEVYQRFTGACCLQHQGDGCHPEDSIFKIKGIPSTKHKFSLVDLLNYN